MHSKVCSLIEYESCNTDGCLSADSLSGNSVTVLICCVKPNAQSIAATSNTLQFAAKARALKTKVIYSSFKTPGRSMRTPLAPFRNNVVTPGGSCFAVPSVKFNMQKTFEDLDESILVSGCHGAIDRRSETRPGAQNLEDRLHASAMEKIDAFLEEFRERMNQSLLRQSIDASVRLSHLTTLKPTESSRISTAPPKCQSKLMSTSWNMTVRQFLTEKLQFPTWKRLLFDS